MPPANPQQLKQQLLSSGNSDFVIFTASGQIVEHAGVFSGDKQRCEAAYAVVQQSATILKPEEKLRKVTVNFEDASYIATVANIGGKAYGVVVQRPIAISED